MQLIVYPILGFCLRRIFSTVKDRNICAFIGVLFVCWFAVLRRFAFMESKISDVPAVQKVSVNVSNTREKCFDD